MIVDTSGKGLSGVTPYMPLDAARPVQRPALRHRSESPASGAPIARPLETANERARRARRFRRAALRR